LSFPALFISLSLLNVKSVYNFQYNTSYENSDSFLAVKKRFLLTRVATSVNGKAKHTFVNELFTLLMFLMFSVYQMAPFRWKNVEHDIALCRQFTGDKPDKPSEWDELAKKLSCLFNKDGDVDVSLTGRGCREHLDLIVKKFKSEERKSLKR